MQPPLAEDEPSLLLAVDSASVTCSSMFLMAVRAIHKGPDCSASLPIADRWDEDEATSLGAVEESTTIKSLCSCRVSGSIIVSFKMLRNRADERP